MRHGRKSAPTVFMGILLGTLSLVMAACSTNAPNPTTSAIPSSQNTGIGQVSPFLSSNLATVSCAVSTCIAGGTHFQAAPHSATLVTSMNLGETWAKASTSAPATAAITGTACSSAGCLAIGTDGATPIALRASGSPLRWTTASDIPGGGTLEAVGCAPKAFCLAIAATPSGLYGVTTTTVGASWKQVGVLTGPTTMTTISCSSSTTCIATGFTANGIPAVSSTNDGGTSWTPSTLPTGTTRVTSAACRTDDHCFATAIGAGGSPEFLRSPDGGATFITWVLPPTVTSPDAVACVSSTCVVTGGGGLGQGAAAVLHAKASPKAITLTYAPNALVSVSCSTTHRCEAVAAASLVALSL